jgi:flavin reductase (DIM6/NTAB) family NADH-FMN oxidoreductase RutF
MQAFCYTQFLNRDEWQISLVSGGMGSTMIFADICRSTIPLRMILDLQDLKPAEKQYYLQHVIAPRPVCFASTIDKEGNINLSPFSFFNMFSSNPPIVIFSPARRVRDNTTKHTLENVLQVPEVVINIVTFDMVQQVSLASCEYPKDCNEFVKAGFTEQPATLIRPPMVKESKVKLECKVVEVKHLGAEPGSGNLVICEVLRMHIDDALLDENKKMDQRKINHIARLGGDWYCVVNEHNLFQVEKPNTQLGIGIDILPLNIRQSTILTGNNLGQLANVHDIPVIEPSFDDAHLKQIIQYYSVSPDEMEKELHLYAKKLLEEGKVREAWQVLLSGV